MKIGDRFRIPAGTGTQLARVEEIRGELVFVRRYRARSGKWNKRLDCYMRDRLDHLRSFGRGSRL